jgi:Protein of unknown function (DUF3168)
MSAAWELQKTVFAVVQAALPSVPVHDAVPDNEPAPYVRIGETTDVEWDTDSSVGREVTVTIHTWSAYRGFKEVKEMMDAIKAALHNTQPAVAGEKVVLMLQEFAEVSVDSDGLTRHGVQRFRVLMEGT